MCYRLPSLVIKRTRLVLYYECTWRRKKKSILPFLFCFVLFFVFALIMMPEITGIFLCFKNGWLRIHVRRCITNQLKYAQIKAVAGRMRRGCRRVGIPYFIGKFFILRVKLAKKMEILAILIPPFSEEPRLVPLLFKVSRSGVPTLLPRVLFLIRFILTFAKK